MTELLADLRCHAVTDWSTQHRPLKTEYRKLCVLTCCQSRFFKASGVSDCK